MARAHFVKKARRAVPDAGIAIGDSYYWWKFRFGGKHYSKTAPRRSQLTQSEFLSTLYEIEDLVGTAISDAQKQDSGDLENMGSVLREAAERLRDLGQECQENYDNMPEGLQQGETGQLLENRASECESKADELESAADTAENLEIADPKDWKQWAKENGHLQDEDVEESADEYHKRILKLIEEENSNTHDEAISEAENVDLSID